MPSKGYKHCSGCDEDKPIIEFHRHCRMRDGLTSQCKVCNTEKARTWQLANPEKAAKRKQGWAERNREKTRESQRQWAERNAEALREASRQRYQENREQALEQQRRSRERYPEKTHARAALNYAVEVGYIVKPKSCEDCGEATESFFLHGHHHDYEKPLEVDWLCKDCHGLRHRR